VKRRRYAANHDELDPTAIERRQSPSKSVTAIGQAGWVRADETCR
jgi:hypothetical protein